MVAWQMAGSLEELRVQLNELAPHRSTASDGGIGNAEHASRESDHNPWWVLAGVPYVTARDFTHDPAGGLSCGWLADMLARGRDQRVKYVIWDGHIMAGAAGPSPWVWRAYTGANAHEHHLHLSVVPDARALVRIPWRLTTAGVATTPTLEDDMSAEIEQMVRDIHGEMFKRLPNRRGPQGSEIPNGGAETILGYAANADGSGFRASWTLADISEKLDALAEAVHGAPVGAAGLGVADPQAFASAVVAALAKRLTG